MNNSPIGVFDSGLGGLTAVKEMLSILPTEDIIYFGDTGRVPYGSKSVDTIKKYAMQDIAFLKSKGVKMIVAACGTVSSVADEYLKNQDIPFTGVVEPTCISAMKSTKNGKIGVIGTSATISSHSYKRIITSQKDFEVFEQDCPLFVPLVESGITDKDDELVKLTIHRYLKGLKDCDVDTLILGCTHYPILKEAIQNEMGSDVTLIDSGRETAIYTKNLLSENGLLSDKNAEGTAEFFVSDTPHNFEKIAGLFLGRDMKHSIKRIDIEQY